VIALSEVREEVREIIIVKRRAPLDDDDHHGGVWKIAFADFMTAMMAFFLVLWIVNATSKETQSAIARYFNPIKVTDTTPAPRGLKDPKRTDFDSSLRDKTKEVNRSVDEEGYENALEREKHRRNADFDFTRRDVDKMKSNFDETLSMPKDIEASSELAVRGNALVNRDPFAFSPSGGKIIESSEAPREVQVQPPNPQNPLNENARQDIRNRLFRAVTEKVLNALSGMNTAFKDADAKVSVAFRIEAEGLLIVLSDSSSFSMFPLGQSTPSARAAETIAAVARVLAGVPGRVVVRGHTDSRSFRSDSSDNWRLSQSRSHAAFAVLRQFGVAEERVLRLEGYGDRMPINRDAPLAPENRRIEILLALPT
jgi:chemotaxis protein MotB